MGDTPIIRQSAKLSARRSHILAVPYGRPPRAFMPFFSFCHFVLQEIFISLSLSVFLCLSFYLSCMSLSFLSTYIFISVYLSPSLSFYISLLRSRSLSHTVSLHFSSTLLTSRFSTHFCCLL